MHTADIKCRNDKSKIEIRTKRNLTTLKAAIELSIARK